MNELKAKALAKMLEEMNKDHSPAEDSIHNWLCEQEDEKLFQGILDSKKSIKEAMKYCINEAKKLKTGNVAMVDDQTVFGWVYKYFTGSVAKTKTTQAVVAVGPKDKNATSKKAKKEKGVADGQLDLFADLLDEV